MGCFNAMCNVSHLPIMYHDKCRLVILKRKKRDQFDSRTVVYSTDLVIPLTAPIQGTYDDYGHIEDIVEDGHTKWLVAYLKCLYNEGRIRYKGRDYDNYENREDIDVVPKEPKTTEEWIKLVTYERDIYICSPKKDDGTIFARSDYQLTYTLIREDVFQKAMEFFGENGVAKYEKDGKFFLQYLLDAQKKLAEIENTPEYKRYIKLSKEDNKKAEKKYPEGTPESDSVYATWLVRSSATYSCEHANFIHHEWKDDCGDNDAMKEHKKKRKHVKEYLQGLELKKVADHYENRYLAMVRYHVPFASEAREIYISPFCELAQPRQKNKLKKGSKVCKDVIRAVSESLCLWDFMEVNDLTFIPFRGAGQCQDWEDRKKFLEQKLEIVNQKIEEYDC